jgi:plasmid stabilization system protein ParE
MTPRLFVRGDAAADLDAASEWYEERRAGLGGEFLRAARATLAGIARAPEQFPVARSPIRRALVRRFPYAIYFFPEPGQTVVIGVLHVRRDPHVWQSRA